MKPTLRIVLLLCSFLLVRPVASQQVASVASSVSASEFPSDQASESVENPSLYDPETFTKAAKEAGVAVRQAKQMASLTPGYYLITGAFSKVRYQRRQVRKLKKRDFPAGDFTNPENGLHYVYASHLTAPEDALRAASTHFEGSYSGDLWILLIEGIQPPEEIIVPDAKDSQGNTAYTDAPLVQEFGNRKNQLIRKADAYFDKMWYAEAAKLYESALERNPDLRTRQTIKRLADAHYFNTDMERAYYWYEILYNMDRSGMSAENLFRYAHSLKGNGKYGRARRFMRLYDKKVAESSARATRNDLATREAILDNIVNGPAIYGVKNMEINSKYSDFAPMFYGDDEVVFASSVDSAFFHTRRYKWNNQPYLDLYVAKMNEERDELRNAVKFSKVLNSKYHEAAVTFSPDRQTIYFTRNNYGKKLRRDNNGVNHLKLYRSRKVDGRWTEAEELPFNGENYSTGHPALSPDGKQLYFVSDMPGSIGGTDIFVVDVLEDGGYSDPRNLGPEINTEQKEMFPFINGHTLYFASNGHIGLGGLDIYEVSFDEASDGFLEVRNMGQPINSNKDDFSYIVDQASQKGFFASNRRGGKGDDDLYSFQRLVPEEANENAIAGVITDLITGEVIPDAMVTLLDANNMKLKEVRTNGEGAFVFEELEGSTRYTVRYDKEGYADGTESVETLDNEQVAMEISMQRLDDRIVAEDGVRKLRTENIYFNFDKYTIRSDAAAELDKLVATLNEYPTMVIAIESHTDSRGPRVYNKYLSQQRAKATKAYLIQQGIDPNRIERAEGFGEERLLNECDGTVRCSREKHQLNRRSEFIIVRM